MRWPWRGRAEARASYTETVVSALLSAAQGTSVADAHRTAALEAVAAIFAGAFARATANPAVPGLTAPVRASIARRLIRNGEAVYGLSVDAGGLRMAPASGWDIRGGADPETWRYRLDFGGPDGMRQAMLPAGAVLHFRYSYDPARPWAGIGPLGWASETGTLAGRIESGLAMESQADPALLLPVPQDGGDGGEDDPLKTLKSDIKAAKGRTALVETTAGGWDGGTTGAPRRDWEQKRVGADWPDVLRATRENVFAHVAAACGVPAALLDPRAQGASQREAVRRYLHFALEPLGEIVAAELRDKLDLPAVEFDFGRLMASDLAGKARAVGIFVKAGVALDRALRIAGIAE